MDREADDDAEVTADAPSRVTRAEASRLLGVAPRTIDRRVASGLLTRGKDGRFALDDLRAQADEIKTEDTDAADDEEKQARRDDDILVKALKQSLDHNERMMRAFEAPLEQLNAASAAHHKLMLEQLTAMQTTVQQAWEVIGDMAMRKEEAETLRQTRQERLESIKSAGRAIDKWMPTLLEQFAAGKGFKAFAKTLDQQERIYLWALVQGFEEDGKKEKAEALGDLLKSAGIPQPVAAEDAPAEQPTESAEAK